MARLMFSVNHCHSVYGGVSWSLSPLLL